MTESLHRAEVRYTRTQMIIAALNLAATSLISITGLWIAHEVNANSELERKHEREQDDARKHQQDASELAARHNDVITTCISLKFSEMMHRSPKTALSPEMQKISDVIRGQCKNAGLDFENINFGKSSFTPRVAFSEDDIKAAIAALTIIYSGEGLQKRSQDSTKP